MKQPRNSTSNRGYRLTPKAVTFVQEQRTPLYQLSPKGIAFVQDCNAKLGAIAEDENLPRPTAKKEQLYSDLKNRLDCLPTIPLNAYEQYEAALEEIAFIRSAIYEIESAPEKSHADLVNEEIDLYEQETAKKPEKPQKNTLSKGAKLEMLMTCSERLGVRIKRFLNLYLEASDYDSKRYWWEKLRAAEKADNRVIRKIGLLFTESN